MKKKNLIIEAIHLLEDAINEKYGVKILFQSLPIIWTTIIVQVFHSTFYDESGNMNSRGIIGAIVTALISIIVLLLTERRARKERDEKEEELQRLESENTSYLGEVELRRVITESECTLEEQRVRNLRQKIVQMKPGDEIRRFTAEALYPQERINSVMEAMSKCFSVVLEIPQSDFTLSGAVKLVYKKGRKCRESEWEWIALPKTEGAADLEDLLTHNSVFRIVAEGRPYYSANDKNEAFRKGEYYKDGRDESYGNGSIICIEIDEDIGKWKVRLIISISTYGRKIVSDEEIAEGADLEKIYGDKIRDIVFKQFEGEIKEDLLWYMIQHVDLKKDNIVNIPQKENEQ